jgi:type III pantothenate kinase
MKKSQTHSAVVDIGNSRIKAALFEGGKLRRSAVFPLRQSDRAARFVEALPVAVPVIVSDVAGRRDALVRRLRNGGRRVLVLSSALPLPVRLLYRPKAALGRDRLANAAGARALFPGKPVLIVDAGSCLKIDFIDRRGCFRGGAISPGLLQRFDALHRGTARLPLVKPAPEAPYTGASTADSIRAGVQRGMAHEIEGAVRYYRGRHKALRVVLTGGDWIYLANWLKSPIFAAPALTLIGLNEILNFNRPRGSQAPPAVFLFFSHRRPRLLPGHRFAVFPLRAG